MLELPRKMASALALRSRLALFGNNHSARINLRYARYHKAARKTWRPTFTESTAQAVEAARQFTEQGWAVLPPFISPEVAAALGHQIDTLFESGEGIVKVGPGLLRLVDGVERVPGAAQFASGFASDVIENFFGSHFKIYNISFYRTIPDNQAPISSFLWHFDNVPDQEIKLMVYFDHVHEDTGAFRFKNRALSEDLRKQGFWHRKNYNKVAPRLDDPSTTVCVEGAPGTTILFQNGRVAHKATAPQRLHRDVATFAIIPSTIPWREHFARNRHLLSTNAGICNNPWTDEPENIGYRY